MGGPGDTGDGCFHTAMFGNGIGEKKHCINEMAAYYLAGAVVSPPFLPIQLYRVPVINIHTVKNPVCMHIFHACP